jgi:protein-S-isoprenylcysteine O-methyltransferase Ste14
MAYDEGRVKDLVEKLKKGEITPKEAKEGMKTRGVSEQNFFGGWVWVGWPSLFIAFGVYFVLWLFLGLPEDLKPSFLRFSIQLPAINFPAVVIYISLVLLVVFGIFVMVWHIYLHRTRGGLKIEGETIIFYKAGPNCVMRNPGNFGFMVWFILVPIILSAHIQFTLLSVVAIITITVWNYYMVYMEEKMNVAKWGDEYRQYMKEVPRFNFIKGLWNLKKRK